MMKFIVVFVALMLALVLLQPCVAEEGTVNITAKIASPTPIPTPTPIYIPVPAPPAPPPIGPILLELSIELINDRLCPGDTLQVLVTAVNLKWTQGDVVFRLDICASTSKTVRVGYGSTQTTMLLTVPEDLSGKYKAKVTATLPDKTQVTASKTFVVVTLFEMIEKAMLFIALILILIALTTWYWWENRRLKGKYDKSKK